MKFLVQLLTVSSIVLFLASSRADAQPEEVITKLPDPQPLTLKTADLVSLHCTYYPGGIIEGRDKKYSRKSGKEVVPVILLHGWEGQRGDYDALASYLQKQGHAVVVPDLRGHGRSTKLKLPNGNEIVIDRDRMRSSDINSMVKDVEAVKKFLLQKNNAGELNIEMFCIVGAELGAIIGVNYAALDWSRPQLSFQKQGRDVKALVLLSPLQSFKGATLAKALLTPAVKQILSVMLVVAEGDLKSIKDTKAIHKRLEKYHKGPKRQDVAEKKDLFLITKKKTRLKGTDLVHPRANLDVHVDVMTFIKLRLVNKKEDHAWKERKNPLAVNDE